MAWSKNKGRSGGWAKKRKTALERDNYSCTVVVDGLRCFKPAKEVDHIINIAKGGTDELTNLASICSHHHKIKTQREAREGRLTSIRPKENHPGIIA